MKFLILIYLIFIGKECKSQEENPCLWKKNCASCIQTDPRCAWCSQEDYTERKISRCDLIWNLQEMNCTELVNPSNTSYVQRVKEPLSIPGASSQGAIQIFPQWIDLTLKPNFPATFSVQFRQVVAYPIDVYYLVDISDLMKSHTSKIIDLGGEIKKQISTNFTTGTDTSYYKLGAGSFSDKDAATYSKGEPPNPAHSFRSITNLHTAGLVEFQEAMESLKDALNSPEGSPNIHSPKGTLDAIMQVIVCKEIGWRSGAKKVLVVATSNDFHYAGDGKLSGIIDPNDGKCHMGQNENDKPQDYPSLNQLDRKIKEYNMTLIFAVTDDQLDAYKNLSTRLTGAATERLSNYDGIMKIMRQEYQAISSSIEMKDNTSQNLRNIKITYNSDCSDNENQERNVCKGLKPEDTVNISVTIQFSHCLEKGTNKDEVILIKPVGRDLRKNLKVVLKMTCDCNCENQEKGASERNCSDGGTYGCGICNCNEDRYGPDCECEGNENQTSLDNNRCKRWKGENICSNRGECKCGKCVCNEPEKHYGQFCECSDYSCDQVNNKFCNGHGTCKCGKCSCDDGWSGLGCTCSNSTDNCYNNGVMCSGHGTCECGSCKCDDTFYGQFCEDCPSCPGKCEEYGICPHCMLSTDDENVPEKRCGKECDMKNIKLVEKVEVNDTHQEKTCSVEDEDGCHIYFKYRKQKYENESIIIHARNWKECPSPPDVVAIVAGTIGSIVLAGILMLIMWKLLTDLHDRREFAKFEEERERAKWDRGQNPIFVQPTSTYENPVYNVN